MSAGEKGSNANGGCLCVLRATHVSTAATTRRIEPVDIGDVISQLLVRFGLMEFTKPPCQRAAAAGERARARARARVN
jgi:hypothetical protein